jgi:hypothetical protein
MRPRRKDPARRPRIQRARLSGRGATRLRYFVATLLRKICVPMAIAIGSGSAVREISRARMEACLCKGIFSHLQNDGFLVEKPPHPTNRQRMEAGSGVRVPDGAFDS